ncbi:Tol-Pal system beta propeller repeat protein TolB [Castellaniella sp.]|uniref:Tol-Pal system beta propeller repeat protein TolB n=1 Tax=Castellaniella sp. TaxID=1955812 RepID=UPI0035610589
MYGITRRFWRHSARLAIGLLLMAGLPGLAAAQLRVDISGVGATQYPIAIADFSGSANAALVPEVIRADLTRSGQFRLIGTSGASLDAGSTIDYAAWQARGADYLAYGSVSQSGDHYTFDYRLVDNVRKAEIDQASIDGTESDMRRIAHQIADRIYEKITGIRGVFSTRIAYVLQTGNNYELQIADADGQNPQVMLRSKHAIISPAWSPDGKQLAYVSFESGKSVIYVQTLATGQRQPISNFKGNNSAPAWSPSGQKLAIVLSKDGISQIYTINTDGTDLRRLMRSPLIDTEPGYAPDGQYLVFTSDRGGSPQIYKVAADGGEAQRLTFSGSYNVSPKVSPDGQQLLYVTRRDGAFRIATLGLFSGNEQILTNGPDDQSPSYAPNGMQALYSAVQNGRSVLAVTSIDGRIHQTLSVLNGKVSEPAWGPFTH